MKASMCKHRRITDKLNKAFRPRGYKIFFMLNSAGHEIFSANKYESANKFSYLLAEKVSCSAMFSRKQFTVVSNLRFISNIRRFHAQLR